MKARLAAGLAFAALALTGPPARADVINDLSASQTGADLSEVDPASAALTADYTMLANYLATNYGIFLNPSDTSSANLALMEYWLGLLFPQLVVTAQSTAGADAAQSVTQTPAGTADQQPAQPDIGAQLQQSSSEVPEPVTLMLLGTGLAWLCLYAAGQVRRIRRGRFQTGRLPGGPEEPEPECRDSTNSSILPPSNTS